MEGVLTLKGNIQLISSLIDCASTSTCLNIPQPVQLSRLGPVMNKCKIITDGLNYRFALVRSSGQSILLLF